MTKLTHLDAAGEANMVDVSEKSVTSRTAIAEGCVVMRPETVDLIRQGDAKKGDVLGTARLAIPLSATTIRSPGISAESSSLVSSATSKVRRSRLLTPTSLVPSGSARSSSARSCTSTSTSMPS